MTPTAGIHHVTAICSDAAENIRFYRDLLGLRLVKVTVNFDDPSSYHLYYGDRTGRPGSAMTFFAWTGARRGRAGPPQVTTTAFAVPPGSLGYWSERLEAHDVPHGGPARTMGHEVLSLLDPDGLDLELVEEAPPDGGATGGGWDGAAVPPEHAIRGFWGVTITEEGFEATADLLQQHLGFRAEGSEGDRYRYRAAAGGELGAVVDVRCVPGARRGSSGAGVVHHLAFRSPDDAAQAASRAGLPERGHNVSPVMDRVYFHSIYFREPGGVLFEIATDTPGFTVDQSIAELGSGLMLPPWLEDRRAQIARGLPALP